jgi:hypothetical protein
VSHTALARRVDTTLVRVLAMLLIANSHLEALYPRPWLAGDGLLGNSLFYVLSGFGLAASAETRGLPGFLPWYAKRLIRIYPSLWLFLAASLLWTRPPDLLGSITLRGFIWPTSYSFIMIIVPVYALIYPVLRAQRAWAPKAMMAGAALAYVASYLYHHAELARMARLQLSAVPGYWPQAVFLVAFGVWLAGHVRRVGPGRASHLALAGGMFVVYVGLKLAMVTGHGVAGWPVLHWIMPPLVYALVRGLSQPALVERLRARPWLWRALTIGADTTLEVYIIHVAVAHSSFVMHLPFALNLAVFWATVLPASWALARITTALTRSLKERLAPAA